jgi:hypothetical protein
VGVKDVGSGEVTWELTLENASSNDSRALIEYKIYTITGNEPWLVCLVALCCVGVLYRFKALFPFIFVDY